MSNHDGLLNGTRLICTKIGLKYIEVEVKSGCNIGKIVAIPRIDMISNTGPNEYVNLHRRQFPVALAFAMTINKSQGQNFSRVGLMLLQPVFGHGMLDVALSRNKSPKGIIALLSKSSKKTKRKRFYCFCLF